MINKWLESYYGPPREDIDNAIKYGKKTVYQGSLDGFRYEYTYYEHEGKLYLVDYKEEKCI